MTQYLEQFVQRFNRMVAKDETRARTRVCFAFLLSLEDAVAKAAKGDTAAMKEARALARAIIDLGAGRVLTQEFYADYLYAAKLLATPSAIKGSLLDFQTLDDLLHLRIRVPSADALH